MNKAKLTKKRKKTIKSLSHLISVSIALLLTIGAWAPDTELCATPPGSKGRIMNILRRLVEFNARYPQEKVYLHFDNTGYFIGETMWFTAYCIRTDEERATDISTVLYVELLNPGGDVVETVKLRLVNGMADGCFHLNRLLNSGFYEVRAYTRYMLNWQNVDVFSRVFPVFNRPKKDGDYHEPTINKTSYKNRLPNHRKGGGAEGTEQSVAVNLHFYPEGGHLVQGIPSRVAYTVMEEGLETERGVMEVTPSSVPTPYIYKGQEFPLPEVQEEGCVVRLDVRDDDVLKAWFQVSSGFKDKTLAYLVMHGGTILMADTLTACPTNERAVSWRRIPEGVNQLIVFDEEGRMLCDRLFFKCPSIGEKDSVSIIPVTKRLTPCGKVEFTLTATPNARLSFSATDAATMTGGRTGNLKTWMLLGSEVKGYIAHPDYYFEANDSVHRQDADLLMMVQGWRRYDWNVMIGDSTFSYEHPIEDKLYLRGQVFPREGKKSAAFLHLNAFLWNQKGQTFSGKTITDRDGKFLWAMPGLRGDHHLQIKVKQEQKNADYYVRIDRHFSPTARAYVSADTMAVPLMDRVFFFSNPRVEEGADDEAQDVTDENSHLLQEVKVEGRKHWNLFGEKSRYIWRDESFGQHHASIYYDCDKAAEEIVNRGETMPTVYHWLSTQNEFFRDITPLQAYYEYKERQPLTDEGEVENEFEQTNTSNSPNLYRDGYSYKHRRIIWILNNRYAGITAMGNSFKLETLDGIQTPANQQDLFNQGGHKEYKNFRVTEGTVEPMPMMLSEVKSIYISENPEASLPYLQSSDAQHEAVTIFLYTHPLTAENQTPNLRKTHYYGYKTPETFQMEDYTVLPPMPDIRRTLYWSPCVTTDAEGKATIEFYNNTTCTDMYISMEGITPDGKFIVHP